MINACYETLSEMAFNNKDIVVLGSDAMNIAKRFQEKACGDQYIEMGIAESTLLAAAAGFSDVGAIPFAYANAPFLAYRANEFIRDDLCLQNRNVKIIAYSSGLDYCTLGPTHHATEEVGVLRSFPNLTILSPASAIEVRMMIREAAKIRGPVYIKLGRESGREIYSSEYIFEVGHAKVVREGTDVTLISTSTITYEAIKVAEKAEERGLSIRVINMTSLKPFDRGIVERAISDTEAIYTLEEHNIIGGLGTAVAEVMAEAGSYKKLVRIGINDCFAKGYGNHDEIKETNGLSVNQILNKIIDSRGRNSKS